MMPTSTTVCQLLLVLGVNPVLGAGVVRRDLVKEDKHKSLGLEEITTITDTVSGAAVTGGAGTGGGTMTFPCDQGGQCAAGDTCDEQVGCGWENNLYCHKADLKCKIKTCAAFPGVCRLGNTCNGSEGAKACGLHNLKCVQDKNGDHTCKHLESGDNGIWHGHQCQHSMKQGVPECGAGHYCDWNNNTCEKYALAGEECSDDGTLPECNNAHYCDDSDPANKKCTAYAAVGDTCGGDGATPYCNPQSYCNDSKKCAAYAGVGETCGSNYTAPYCRHELMCDDSTAKCAANPAGGNAASGGWAS